MSTYALRRVGLPVLVVALFLGGLLVAPSPVQAKGPEEAQQHDDIFIESDEQFNPAHGVRSGRGTKERPYVISGWKVNSIFIRDTSAYLVIRDNVIANQLTLNWNGKHVRLVDNEIGDLRVNENVTRTGGPTTGYFARNKIGVVGQLRHFDGVFTKNVVGPDPSVFNGLPFFSDLAVNFDGFHGSRFHHNTIYGYVDVRLHGHHHGSGFNAPSHYHAAPAETEEGHHGHHQKMKPVDHTRRWHRVNVYANKIYSAGPWALRYFDQAHSANDRTAASETNEELNLPHVHYTKVTMKNNKLVGSGLVVDIFNADDENHMKIGHGTVNLVNNQISLTKNQTEPFMSYQGIYANTGQMMGLNIKGNTINWTDSPDAAIDNDMYSSSGIQLQDFDASKIKIRNNRVTGFDFGVLASTFTETVKWWIRDLKTKDVGTRIYYDDSVANHPHRG